MPVSKLTSGSRWARAAAAVLVCLLVAACDAPRQSGQSGRSGSSGTAGGTRSTLPARDVESSAPYQAEVEEGLGAAVAILVDTSGSMKDVAPGDSRPKYIVAREALEAMLDATDAVVAKRSGFPIKVGIYSFSSSATRLLPILPYDRTTVHRILETLPQPGGGTAIGDAMRAARPDLYKAGVFRKYILVVTDGENTAGNSPDSVARDIFRKSEGGVQIHFVAFDTSPQKFAFLSDVGGSVLGATNGMDLKAKLDEIYQGKILAEAVDAGEGRPKKK
jgi:Mg-chelatase subunit ChlD